MRKWKPGYRWILKNNLKDDKGFTLVELLASLALLSIVVVLVGSVHLFGQKQFQAQSYSANQANDIAYSLSVLSREIRQAESITVEKQEGKSNPTYIIDGKTYFNLEDNKLTKNSETIAENIATFKVTQEGESAVITITSSSHNDTTEEYQTTIYFRRGVAWKENK